MYFVGPETVPEPEQVLEEILEVVASSPIMQGLPRIDAIEVALRG